jgi:hypothetical protein
MISTSTQKGNAMTVYDGYAYRKFRTNDESVVTWRCDKQRSLKCTGILKTLPDNAVPLEVTEHNHAPDPARAEALLIRHNILQRAQASLDAPRQIIGTEVAQGREEVAQALPTYNALSLGIRRKRKAYDLPANPASVADLQLPQGQGH